MSVGRAGLADHDVERPRILERPHAGSEFEAEPSVEGVRSWEGRFEAAEEAVMICLRENGLEKGGADSRSVARRIDAGEREVPVRLGWVQLLEAAQAVQ